ISEEAAQEKFGFLLDAFQYGAPPHGGIAFGWDRIIALLAGTDSIREAIAFPKTGNGHDPMTDAPAPITAEQPAETGVYYAPEGEEGSDEEYQRLQVARHRFGSQLGYIGAVPTFYGLVLSLND